MRQVGRIERAVRHSGPLVDVNVGISDGWRKQLWKRNIEPPPAVFATFLVDTGSDSTMVDEQIMRALGLSAISQRDVLTSESKGIAQICNVYDIGLEVLNGGAVPWRIQAVEANGRPLMSETLHGILGRDVLDLVKFTYDGPQRIFTIDYRY